jgi:SAM-dependent methyltransferase
VIEDHERRSRSFGRVAEAYDRFRPAPPPAAAEIFDDVAGQNVWELAAGTGLVSRFLLACGAQLTTVEPDDGMRAVLEARSPGIRSLAAQAQALPAEDASLDVVVVASAWHWFPQPATSLEVGRVLRDGGRLIVVANNLDTTWSWVAQLAELRRSGAGYDGDYATAIPAEGPFDFARRYDLRYLWPRQVEDIVALIATYSSVIVLSEEERSTTAAAVRSLVEEQAEDGLVALPMAFEALTFTRRSRESEPGRR